MFFGIKSRLIWFIQLDKQLAIGKELWGNTLWTTLKVSTLYVLKISQGWKISSLLCALLQHEKSFTLVCGISVVSLATRLS